MRKRIPGLVRGSYSEIRADVPKGTAVKWPFPFRVPRTRFSLPGESKGNMERSKHEHYYSASALAAEYDIQE